MTNYERLMQKIDIYRLANWLYMFNICPFIDKDCGGCKFYDDDRKNPPCSFYTNYDNILKWLKDEENVDKGKSEHLQPLKQYFFNRDDFVNVFTAVFSTDEIFNIEVACQENRSLDDFLLYYEHDEFYIIHLESGTIINWYKHLGRTNTCNKEGFELNDLQELLKELKEEL